MGEWPSRYSFTSILGERGVATQLTSMSAQPLHPERQEGYIISEEEDERKPAPQASKKVSD